MSDIFKAFNVDFNFSSVSNLKLPAYLWFINLFKQEAWEQDTFNVFERVKCKDTVAVDIGAWVGPTTIWLSKNFKSVISVEADPVALRSLRDNIDASNCNNVDIVDKPIYNKSKKIIFGVNEYNDMLKSEGLGNSTSHIKSSSTDDMDEMIDSITIYDILKRKDASNISFLKVDIEGGEENILSQIIDVSADQKWTVFLSFHYDWWYNKNIESFTEQFKKCRSIKVGDSDDVVDAEQLIDVIKGHPFCSVYMEF